MTEHENNDFSEGNLSEEECLRLKRLYFLQRIHDLSQNANISIEEILLAAYEMLKNQKNGKFILLDSVERADGTNIINIISKKSENVFINLKSNPIPEYQPDSALTSPVTEILYDFTK